MAKRKFNKGGEVRLVAYYRYSGGSGQTEQSIEGQRRDCETYARLHNMTIQKEYVDRHISGKTDDRAAFQQMITDSDKGAFDMVICWKTDRFARNRYDSAVYKKRLRDNGVDIVYAAESNIAGAEGIIIEGVMEALAEYYSAELAEKMRRGMRESALKGQAISRCRALGLKTDEHKRFVIDEKTAPTVRFIFEHYAAGESATSIVDKLNAKGLRTSQGNPFNKSSIPRIIQNEAYRGVYVSKSYDVRIEGAIPAIIDDELWERAQTMLKLNRQLKAKNEPKADYILSGKLYCSCGSLMRGMSGHSATGEVYRYYTCPNKNCHLRNIPKDDLEGKVMQSISDHLLQPEAMEALAEAMVEVQKADYEAPVEEQNFATLLEMLNTMQVLEDDEEYQNPVDLLFEELAKKKPNSFAGRQYKLYKLAAGKTAKSILISCGARLAPFDIQELRDLTMYDELQLDTLGDKKTALFLIMSDTDSTFNFLISMVYTQLFNLLCDKADDVYGGKLPIHVRCLIDECANIGQIPQLEKLVATIRSREISACLVLQARSQLKAIYKDNADTIVGNMDSQIFLGGSEPTTLKDLSEMLGKETIDAFNTSDTRGNSPSYGTTFQKMGHELLSRDELAVLDGGKCILQLRGVRPFLSDKYDLTQHPNYKLTSDYDPKNALDIEKFVNRKEKIHPGDEFIVVDADSLPSA